MTIARVVAAETLDHLAPDDPAARRSRRDLRRVHRAMGTRSMLARGWTSLVSPARAEAPLRVLELGAGDGTLLLGLARSLSPRWPRVELSLLDRQAIVAPATLAGFADLGWQTRVQVADVLDWARVPAEGAPGAAFRRWDLISTSLFLHHFDTAELARLLGAVATRCDRFFACEPGRSRLALAGAHLVGALGVNAVTRHDAVLSVQAGFRGQEISSLWPWSGAGWLMRENTAGWFSHCFSAQRIVAAARGPVA